MPFNDSNSLTWEEYVVAYKKKIDEREKVWKAREIKYGRKYDVPYPKIEIIIEKNRKPLEDFLKKEGLR